jgi:hypothetical protein
MTPGCLKKMPDAPGLAFETWESAPPIGLNQLNQQRFHKANYQ